jgi:uncharacterized protein (DUF2062 family)
MNHKRISFTLSWRDFLSGDRIKALTQYFYRRFVKIRGKPEDIAWGMAVGLFIGMTPTFGIQMYIAILVAAILKKSKISAAIGVWITNPITIPFFYGITYYLGAKILGYPLKQSVLVNLSFEALRAAGKSVFISLWVGGVVAGLVVGVIGYFVTLQIIQGGKREAEQLRKKRAKRIS